MKTTYKFQVRRKGKCTSKSINPLEKLFKHSIVRTKQQCLFKCNFTLFRITLSLKIWGFFFSKFPTDTNLLLKSYDNYAWDKSL